MEKYHSNETYTLTQHGTSTRGCQFIPQTANQDNSGSMQIHYLSEGPWQTPKQPTNVIILPTIELKCHSITIVEKSYCNILKLL